MKHNLTPIQTYEPLDTFNPVTSFPCPDCGVNHYQHGSAKVMLSVCPWCGYDWTEPEVVGFIPMSKIKKTFNPGRSWRTFDLADEIRRDPNQLISFKLRGREKK